MRRTKILNAKEAKRTTFAEAENAFYKHCKLKNLRPSTINYYREDLTFFHTKTGVKYIDEVNQDTITCFLPFIYTYLKKIAFIFLFIYSYNILVCKSNHNITSYLTFYNNYTTNFHLFQIWKTEIGI